MKTFKTILIALAALLVSVSCIYEGKEEEFEIKVGAQIPDFAVTMSDGSVVTSEDLGKGVSLIMFFHTDCPDCQNTLPSVQRIHDEYLSKGVSFALISRSQLQEDIEPYWQEKGYTMPYSPQKDRVVYNLFATSRVPRVYVCKDGKIFNYYTDSPIPTYEDLNSDLNDLI